MLTLAISVMQPYVSVIVPVYNSENTIEKCLDSVYSSTYPNFEVIAVNDCSTDSSGSIIKKFPCKTVNLRKRSGVSKSRNEGAKQAKGKILFFIDSDCVLQKDTIERVVEAMKKENTGIIGGTYTKIPFDNAFFSIFQSLFVHYGETKKKHPDYISAHCLAIDSKLFRKFGGFIEDSFIGVEAGVEDVELCHRMGKAGYRMTLLPEIQVRHIFGFSFWKSLKNAAKKSMYWTAYSLKNKDITKDSGCASVELKLNAVSFFLNVSLVSLFLISGSYLPLLFAALIFLLNLIINRKFLHMIYEARGLSFTLVAAGYYFSFYAFAVAVGALLGFVKFLRFRYFGHRK